MKTKLITVILPNLLCKLALYKIYKNYPLSELFNYEVIFSTAPASPGLLIILTGSLNWNALPSLFSPVVFAARQQHAADYLLLDIWPSLVWQEQLAALCQHSGVCCLLPNTSVIVLLRPDDC